MKLFFLAALLFWPLLANAQLSVSVLPVKVAGQKAVVPLALKNNFTEKIESARAVCFLADEQGKVVGHAAQWVIGGTKDRPTLAPGATNSFNFVVAAAKPFTATNLTAKVTFSRLVLEGGRLADPCKAVSVSPAASE